MPVALRSLPAARIPLLASNLTGIRALHAFARAAESAQDPDAASVRETVATPTTLSAISATAYDGFGTLDDLVQRIAADVAARFPTLDTVINNAGIQRLLDFSATTPPTAAELTSEVDANLMGVLHVTAAFLPVLRRQPSARLVNVGSGLAFVPLVTAPVYSATKAAVRAFTIALREQLRGTSVQVVELIPPVVESNLHRGQSRKPPRAMPLAVFVAKAMQALDSGRDELPIGLAAVLRIGVRVAPSRFLRIVNRGSER